MEEAVEDMNQEEAMVNMEEEIKVSLEQLPSEVLVNIFSYLDIQSLDNIETVTEHFKDILNTSVQIWKHKINMFCRQKSQLLQVLNYSEYSKFRTNAKSLREFYKKLQNLQTNLDHGQCDKKVLDCQGATQEERKVLKTSSAEWSRNHNFRGVYDMTLDEGRICASVYDTIQIWCTKELRLLHLFTNDVLDQDKTQTTCFTLNKNQLICGTDNGYLKILDIHTEKLLAKSRINSQCLSDVKCKDDIIISLDCFGSIVFWKFDGQHQLQEITMNSPDSFNVPHILGSRDMERLMDANQNHLITTFKSHITVYRFGQKEGLVISFPVYSVVFCIHLVEDMVAFGCKGSPRHDDSPFVHPVAGIANLKFTPPRVQYLRTPDNDPVISIFLTSSRLILGDVNGEIHVISTQNFNYTEVEHFADIDRYSSSLLYVLRSHGYTDFIWALKFDGFRLFSGDETGKIIVHDFLNYEPDHQPQLKLPEIANGKPDENNTENNETKDHENNERKNHD